MHIKPCGEQALIVDITEDDAQAVGLTVLRTVLRLKDVVASWHSDGVIDLVPAATTLLIMLDTTRVVPRDIEARLYAVDLAAVPASAASETIEVRIPTRYDGPDIASLAEKLGWSPQELVARHQETVWTAAFGGFAPGFSYLTPDTPWPAIPRLDSPRPAIPAGSVGLAGDFSGIYPQQSPGGWQLIGTTDEKLWDPTREDRPALIMPGDIVRFVEAE